MPTFEVDVRGGDASDACEQLSRSGLAAELLPGGIAIATLDADSEEEVRRRIGPILGRGPDEITIRRAGDHRRSDLAAPRAAKPVDDDAGPRVEDRP